MKRNIVPASVWQRPSHFIAFGFGSGAAPFAPGTFGTLVGLPCYYFMHTLTPGIYATLLIVAFVAGVWLCDRVSRDIGVHDHGGIVWDEIVGYLVTMFWAPFGWQWMLIGFLLFRLFDIWKPFPIRFLDKHVTGGFGIMIDDVLAGVYANICIQLMIVYGIVFN
jgi:phosphatidylglycerophosphatase A